MENADERGCADGGSRSTLGNGHHGVVDVGAARGWEEIKTTKVSDDPGNCGSGGAVPLTVQGVGLRHDDVVGGGTWIGGE